MSKVKFMKCDICGGIIYSDSLTTRIKGKRRIPLLSGSYEVDICKDCIQKISELVNEERRASDV